MQGEYPNVTWYQFVVVFYIAERRLGRNRRRANQLCFNEGLIPGRDFFFFMYLIFLGPSGQVQWLEEWKNRHFAIFYVKSIQDYGPKYSPACSYTHWFIQAPWKWMGFHMLCVCEWSFFFFFRSQRDLNLHFRSHTPLWDSFVIRTP